ncbi:MAG: hypothetical protein WDW36_005388 [Sanguina aurantia]
MVSLQLCWLLKSDVLLTRRDISVASTSYEQSTPQPPPPPPPPFQQQDTSRRGALGYAGAAVGFMLTGGSVGWVLANNMAAGDSSTFSGAEQTEIVSLREEAGFRRDFDGSLWLQAPSGTWYEAKLDAQVPGTVLLRNDQDSTISFISFSMQQIDLTDDTLVTSVFGDRNWPALLEQVPAKNDIDQLIGLALDRDGFQNLVSILE